MKSRFADFAGKGGPRGRPFFICTPILIAAALAASGGTAARAQDSASAASAVKLVERSDDDLVLVSVRVGRSVVADSVQGYASKNTLMLPLGQLASVLQFPINVVPQEGRADGWFLEQDNSFSLDLARKEVIIAGKSSTIDPALVEAHRDDIYVDTGLLSKWLPLDFDFSFAAQAVTIKPHEGVQLPIERAGAREQARRQLAYTEQESQEPLPRLYTPYQFATVPFTDITYSSGYDKQVRDGTYNEFTALANGDLFYMQNRVYLSLDQEDKLNDLRWTLSRRDPDGKIFQPGERLGDSALGQVMHQAEVREVAFGDINNPQTPLIATTQQGRGALISNIPYDRATQYDRTTLQGDLPPDWEVELYRNDELLSFQRALPDGRYQFNDVPLVSGLNIIRLVFYGPFGQTREEVQRFRVTDQLTQQGKSYFRLSASQQDTSIFNVQQRNRDAFNFVGTTPLQNEIVRGQARGTLEYEYGLTDKIAAFANAASYTTADDEQRHYGGLGLATTLAGTYARADVAHETQSGGNAYELALQDYLYGISLSANSQHFRNFIGDYTENVTDPLTNRTILRADTPFGIGSWRFNAGLAGSRSTYELGRVVKEASARISTSVQRLSLTHTLTRRTDTSPGATTLVLSPVTGFPTFTTFADKQTYGEILASFPYNRLVLRGNLRYGISPDHDFQTASASAEYHFTRDTNAFFAVDRQELAPVLTTYTLGLNHRFEKLLVGGRVSHDDDGRNALGATVSLSFGPNPRTGQLEMFPDYTARDGIISTHAYHDMNSNGRADLPDQPLENVRWLVNGGNSERTTDSQGNAMLRNVLPDVHTRLTLDDKSLQSPYLISASRGFDVVPRPGVPVLVNYPVSGSGDVEGTVYLTDADGQRKEAANVAIQLIDAKGAVVRETRTAYDGFYLIDAVPTGNYALRVSPDQVQRLGFAPIPDRAIAIGNEEENVLVADMSIQRTVDGMAPATAFAATTPPAAATPATAAAATTAPAVAQAAPVVPVATLIPAPATAAKPVQVAAQTPPPRNTGVPAEWDW